jgi:hypothetical protein
MGRGWMWAWRVEQAVFGRRWTVKLSVEVLSLPASFATIPNPLLGPPGFADGDGLRIWLPPSDQLKALRRQLAGTPRTDLLFSPTVFTANGVESELSEIELAPPNGPTNSAGSVFQCVPLVHPDSTDFAAWVTHSEFITNTDSPAGGTAPVMRVSVRTNLDRGFRIQIPAGHGVFMLQGSPAGPNGEIYGVLINPPQP